jgi:enoyl-CoA hydratase/carnithine racemase
LVSHSGGILTITLNRPDRLNIFDAETRREILGALKEYEPNPDIKCVLVNANGEAFSAGADLNYLISLRKNETNRYAAFVRSFLRYVEDYPKPTVGAAQGIAVGGGLELLMTLDIVVASRDARFGQTELNVGLIPGGGGSQRLPRLVGLRKAKEMIYTGGLVSADEALAAGLVNILTERENLARDSLELCRMISSKSPLALRLAKRALKASQSGVGRGLLLESGLYARMLNSSDGKEGMRAFLEKRKPNYTGE